MIPSYEYIRQVLDRARTERVGETELLIAMEMLRKLQAQHGPCVKPPYPFPIPPVLVS